MSMGGVKVGGNRRCFFLPFHARSGSCGSPPSPQTFSPTSSPIVSSNTTQTRLRRGRIEDHALITCNFTHQSDRLRLPSPSFATSPKLPRRRSLDDFGRQPRRQVLRRASSASLDDGDNNGFFPENGLQEIAAGNPDIREADYTTTISRFTVEPPWRAIEPDQPDWIDREETIPGSVEMRANSIELPLSIRIIKRKMPQQQQQAEACCSVRKAFSSMVFIVRELQSYTLRMREVLCYENLQDILARVQGEMNASFAWLFQQIFSCTPTLMVCLMLLLANFTVYSIDRNSAAMAAVPPDVPTTQAVAELHKDPRFDARSIDPFSAGRTASVGGGGSGGGKVKPAAGATDDGGQSDGSEAAVVAGEEEMLAWNRIKEEATRMQASSRGEALMDAGVLHRLVSPVKVELEPEDHSGYWRTELVYQQALSQDPGNAMVLCNFAQFLYLVLRDHDRAEKYFKRAAEAKPADAEALNRYANFLWLARNDLGAAEEMYLEAIAADPSNSYYAANYANFLWNTGGEDTCYPLDDGDDCD